MATLAAAVAAPYQAANFLTRFTFMFIITDMLSRARAIVRPVQMA